MNKNKKVALLGGGAIVSLLVLSLWIGGGFDVNRGKGAELNGAASGEDEAGSGGLSIFFQKDKEKAFADAYLNNYQQKPVGVTDEQWRQVNASLLGHPDWKKESKRVAGYMATQNQYLKLLELLKTTSPPTAQMQDMARELERGLEDKIKNEQVSAGDALLIKSIALKALYPNPADYNKAYDAWMKNDLTPLLPTAKEDPRDKIYLKKQDEVIAKWEKEYPPEAVDVLEKQLDALRNEIYFKN